MQAAIDDHEGRTAQAELHSLNAAIKEAGLSPFPVPDESKLVKVTPPTHDEIREAARAAKGDPGASAKVQALQAREWLANHKALREQATISLREAKQQAKASTPELMEQLHAEFKKVAAVLEAEVKTELGRITNLDAVDFSGFSREQAMRAYDLRDAYREALALFSLWRIVHAFIGAGGMRKDILWAALSNPTAEQYAQAMAAKPRAVPDADPWAIVKKGWLLDLAVSPQEVTQRVDSLSKQYEARRTRPKRSLVPEPYRVEFDGPELFSKTKY